MTRDEYAAARRQWRLLRREARQWAAFDDAMRDGPARVYPTGGEPQGRGAPHPFLAQFPPAVAATFGPPLCRSTYLLDRSIATHPETRDALARACWRRQARIRRQALEAVVSAYERKRRMA